MTKCAGDAMNPDIEGVVPSAKSSPDINNVPMYLGDGVYFDSTPYQVEIYTTDGISTGSSIFLDVHTAEALVMQLKKWMGE